jgi:NTE family protein
VRDILSVDEHKRPAGRALERYQDMSAFADSENRPYLHLVDGGVSDNIGVRGVLDAMEQAFLSHEFAEERGFMEIRRLVIIVANAHSQNANDWEKKESSPGMFSQLMKSSGVPIERYSFETIELMKDRAAVASWRRDLLVARARLAGMSEEEAEASVPNVEVHVMEVSFDRIADPERRSTFQGLPTSFVLSDAEVDSLRSVAGELMQQSPEYRGILSSFGVAIDE